MKNRLLSVSISLLLCACSPSSDRETAQPAAAPADSPVAASDAPAPATPAPTSTAAMPTVPATPGAQAAANDPAAGDQAVNDSIDANLGDHAKYQAAIRDLQSAVAAGDAARVASLAQYPFSVDIGGKATVLKDEQGFAARYQDFMTPDISKAIVETKYADLFVNYKGVMFGSGQAWLNGICKDNECKAFDVKLVALQHGPD